MASPDLESAEVSAGSEGCVGTCVGGGNSSDLMRNGGDAEAGGRGGGEGAVAAAAAAKEGRGPLSATVTGVEAHWAFFCRGRHKAFGGVTGEEFVADSELLSLKELNGLEIGVGVGVGVGVEAATGAGVETSRVPASRTGGGTSLVFAEVFFSGRKNETWGEGTLGRGNGRGGCFWIISAGVGLGDLFSRPSD